MEVLTPVFTTSRPGFMASTSDCNQEFIDKMQGEKRILHTDVIYQIYIDGELQDILGYDIPIFLSGTITGERQDCIVWNVEGTESHEAEITYDHGGHTYIRLKS